MFRILMPSLTISSDIRADGRIGRFISLGCAVVLAPTAFALASRYELPLWYDSVKCLLPIPCLYPVQQNFKHLIHG